MPPLFKWRCWNCQDGVAVGPSSASGMGRRGMSPSICSFSLILWVRTPGQGSAHHSIPTVSWRAAACRDLVWTKGSNLSAFPRLPKSVVIKLEWPEPALCELDSGSWTMPGQLRGFVVFSCKSQPRAELPHQNFPCGSFPLPSIKTDGLCACRATSQITRGCEWGNQACSASRFYKNHQEFSLDFPQKGKNPLFAAVWQKWEGKGHTGQGCDPPLGLQQQRCCSRRSFKRNGLFQHFIWLQVPLELASLVFNELRRLEVFCTQAWYSPETQLLFVISIHEHIKDMNKTRF